MKLGKIISGIIDLVEVENGREVGGKQRNEDQLYAAGYKKACPYMGDEPGDKVWREYPWCLVEEIAVPEEAPIDPDELTAEEALNIIIGG